jgi:phage I-like protein
MPENGVADPIASDKLSDAVDHDGDGTGLGDDDNGADEGDGSRPPKKKEDDVNWKAEFEKRDKSYEELHKKFTEQGQEVGYLRKKFEEFQTQKPPEKPAEEEDFTGLIYTDPKMYTQKLREQIKKEYDKELQSIRQESQQSRVQQELAEAKKRYPDWDEVVPKIRDRMRQPLTYDDMYYLVNKEKMRDTIKAEVLKELEENKQLIKKGKFASSSASKDKKGDGTDLSDEERRVAKRMGISEEDYAKEKQGMVDRGEI